MKMNKKDACNCEKCREVCQQRPCWPTPKEAQALLDKGYSDRLMLDHWGRLGSKGGNIYLLSPAIAGYEKKGAPFLPLGQCTFYSEGGCEIHELKPIEGRLTTPCQKKVDKGLHKHVADLWDNPEAQTLAHSLGFRPSTLTEFLSLLDNMTGEEDREEEDNESS